MGWDRSIQTAGQDDPLSEVEPHGHAIPHARPLEMDLPGSGLPGLAKKLGCEWIEDAARFKPSERFVERIPIAFARKYSVLGLEDFPVGGSEPIAADARGGSGPGSEEQPVRGRGTMKIALAELKHWPVLDTLGRRLNVWPEPLLIAPALLQQLINQAYEQREGVADQAIEEVRSSGAYDGDAIDIDLESIGSARGVEDLLDGSGLAPVIRVVNLILFEAVKSGASDVHFQPYEGKLVVRLRIDGVLFDSFDLPQGIQEEVIGRIKVMGRMNIAEKRLAQDGRATVRLGHRLIDLRISSLPASHGERVVLRLLDKSARLHRLQELGMNQAMLSHFQSIVHREHGLLLVTGPTGSGKSTTLYAALQQIDAGRRNVITLEDPIEYQLQGISQVQVSDRKGMTFATALRHVLRQDPDIIMVGEIRDHDTAAMAIQSALTGHMVYSTLHTNDAASAVTRLLDLGIEPFLISSSLVGVLAQRLVRRVCEACTQPVDDPQSQWMRLGRSEDASTQTLVSSSGWSGMRCGKGCSLCRGTGYRGRDGLFEWLAIDDEIRRLIQGRATAWQIQQAASLAGMRSLREDGRLKCLAGVTTVDEVLRVTAGEGSD